MNVFASIGRYFTLLGSMFTRPEKFSMYYRETMRQMGIIGVGSVSIVAMISFFIGAVTAVQTAFQIIGTFIPPYYVGYIVRDTMLLELASTITCLALAGKVGSNLASELGTMRITEQIDALEIMGINTSAYLIGPKLVAAIITIPLLVILSAFLGIMGGYVAVATSDKLEVANYLRGLNAFFNPYYITIMLVKAVVFGFLLTSIACYHGFYVKGGAYELGKSSTRAVVVSSIAILVADYVLAFILT
jgi:phospholipid/cholesterol/gamma-HCH transport system permease protein